LYYGAVGAKNQGHGAQHEHYRAPGGGPGQNVGGTTRAEGGLAACAAESTGEVRGFAALQQDHNDEHHAVNYEKSAEEPSGIFEAEDDDSQSYEKRDRPFHPTRHSSHFVILAA
jgi:hypothetical protein